MKITITEALAEIKTIGKRIEKKQEFVLQYLVRPDFVRDPLDKEGGSEQKIKETIQSIRDLATRWLSLRMAIQRKNAETLLTVGLNTRTIAEWLIWRREIAGQLGKLWDLMASDIAGKQKYTFKEGRDNKEFQPVVAFPQIDVANEREALQLVLGDLDGKLSLINATTTIEE